MNPTNVLELALRDPSRLTADLAGRTRHAANESRTVHASPGIVHVASGPFRTWRRT